MEKSSLEASYVKKIRSTMGIKLYGRLLTLVITAFSRHFGDIDFEGRVIIFILPISEKRQLMQILTLELFKSRPVSSQLIYDFCRNPVDFCRSTASSYSKFSTTLQCPETSLRISVNVFQTVSQQHSPISHDSRNPRI